MREGYQQDQERYENLREESARISQKEKGLDEWDVNLQQELKQIEEQTRQANLALGMIEQEKGRTESKMQSTKEAIKGLSEKQRQYQDQLHQSEMKVMDLGYQEKALFEKME